MNDATSLAAASEWVRLQVWDDGVTCPCCGQFAKVYRRTITRTMARDLIAVHQQPEPWVHLPRLLRHPGDFAKLRYWGLVEETTEKREDGGRAGWWRVTERGVRFVNDDLTVPRYIYLYDGTCLAVDGELINIRAALGTHFDYAELMRPAGVPAPREAGDG